MTSVDEYATWRRSTAGGIRYKLMDGYPTINVTEEGAKAVERYLLRAQDVEAFTTESIPAPVAQLGSVIRPNLRHLPGATILVTESLDFKPYNPGKPGDPQGSDPNAGSGTYAEIYECTINYSTRELDSDDNDEDPNDPETFLTHSITAGGEHMMWPANKTSTVDEALDDDNYTDLQDNLDQQGPIIKTVPTIEHSLRWKAVLTPPWTKIIQFLGHVNDRTLPLFFGAKKHTVMFMGVSGQQEYLWNGFSVGVQPWSLDFKFSHKEIRESEKSYGWNHIYSPKNGTWRKLFRANGLPLYEESNFLELFLITDEED